MKRMTTSFTVGVLLSALLFVSVSFAAGTAKKTTVKTKTRTVEQTNYNESSSTKGKWAQHYGPWDFSGLLALNNPGFGFQALGAYRFLDNVIPDLDDTMSFETGLGFISVSENLNVPGYNNNSTYSYIEIPIMVRWDIHLPASRFTVGPTAGFYYLSGGTQTVNGVNASTRGGNLYFQLGAVGFFQLSDQFALRAQVGVGGYTNLSFGVTYFL